MKPNNLIYRSIANKITGITFEKFYSSMYYMRAIAEYYNGEPYTGRKPSNKYIKDWYLGLTGESEPETHKYNLWYLREIVKFYDPQQSGLNENQCLSFIDDHIEPPSPVEFDSISLTVSNSILSYADGDTATLTAQLKNGDDDAHLSGKSVSFDIVDGQGTVISNIGSDSTDSNGIATVTYTATGSGDITIQASVEKSGILVSEIYEVHDYFKYIASGSKTFSSSTFTFNNLVDLNDLTGDYEVTVKLSSTQSKAFGIALHQANNSDNTYLARVGFDSNPNAGIVVITTSMTEDYSNTSKHSSANVPYDMSIKRENGVYTLTVDGHSHSLTIPPSNLRYLGLESWNVAKTISYTDFIVKPL